VRKSTHIGTHMDGKEKVMQQLQKKTPPIPLQNERGY